MRMTRLYVPFVIWTALYLSLRAFKHTVARGGSFIDISPALLLNGAAHHLWFLPFALIASLVMLPLGKYLGPLHSSPNWRFLLAGLALFGGLAVAMVPAPIKMDVSGNPVSYFVGMSWSAIPAALWTIPATLWLRSGRGQIASQHALGGWLGCLVLNYWSGGHVVTANLSGVFLFLFCMKAYPLNARAIEVVACVSLGVYLVHVAFVEGFQLLLRLSAITSTLWTDVLVATASLLASVLFCLTVRRVRVLRPLVS